MARTTFSGPVASQNGFIADQFTTTQRNAIVGPTAGLLIFNTTTDVYEVYNGSAWVSAFTNAPVTYTAGVEFAGASNALTAQNTGILNAIPGDWYSAAALAVLTSQPIGTVYEANYTDSTSATLTQTGLWALSSTWSATVSGTVGGPPKVVDTITFTPA
jgi:hypothetical protein